ncbi:MAG TPA: PfkB family carbohydrate kinase [Deferrisomatales bacterium]|nr:PfkB family carbohydrate kinase [Deferrisomatales bacterium]
MPRFDVLCVGRACVDEILEVAEFPDEDTKVPALTRLREGGGQASTAACLISHLGGRAAFVGRIGADAPGAFARRRMAAFGVDLSLLPPPQGVTPAATCLVSRRNASRTIVYEKLSATPLTWDELEPALGAGPRAVLVDPQAEALLPELLRACRDRGTLLVADAERAGAGWEHTWGQVDVLAASHGFLRQAAPGLEPAAALAAIDRHGPGWSCVTLGERGCLVRIDGATHALPALAVPVRDTTGAGDAFHGALALALARGRDPLAAARYATAVASLCCRGLGGRSFPDPEELKQALAPGA